MFKYSDGEGIVRINGLHQDDKLVDIKLPSVAIGVFCRERRRVGAESDAGGTADGLPVRQHRKGLCRPQGRHGTPHCRNAATARGTQLHSQ